MLHVWLLWISVWCIALNASAQPSEFRFCNYATADGSFLSHVSVCPVITRHLLGTTNYKSGKKYFVIGDRGTRHEGLGNNLMAFPGLLYFAIFTSRQVVLAPNSKIEQLCRTIKCGFPFYLDLQKAYPEAFPSLYEYYKHPFIEVNEQFIEGKLLKASIAHSENNDDTQTKAFNHTRIHSSKFLQGTGGHYFSPWVNRYKHFQECLTNITDCPLGDIACYDRFAFQTLIKGPFNYQTQVDLYRHNIMNFPNDLLNKILTKPHKQAPRIDASIHIRTEFRLFEFESNIVTGEVEREKANRLRVNRSIDNLNFNNNEATLWINSTARTWVYESLLAKLRTSLLEQRVLELSSTAKELQYMHTSKSSNTGHANITDVKEQQQEQHQEPPLYVYLSSDNDEVKSDFIQWFSSDDRNIMQYPPHSGTNSRILRKQKGTGTDPRNIVNIPPLSTGAMSGDNTVSRKMVIVYYRIARIHHIKDLAVFLALPTNNKTESVLDSSINNNNDGRNDSTDSGSTSTSSITKKVQSKIDSKAVKNIHTNSEQNSNSNNNNSRDGEGPTVSNKEEEDHPHDGVFNISFDWYCMSLSNIIITWRRGFSMHFASTFAHSAQKVSGTNERTDPKVTTGRGIGTKGYQLETKTNFEKRAKPSYISLHSEMKLVTPKE